MKFFTPNVIWRIFYFFLFFSVSFLRAQDIDQQILEAEALSTDSLKVNKLNKIATKIGAENKTRALEIIDKSALIAAKNAYLQAECMIAYALVYRDNMLEEKALDDLRKALRIYQDKNNFKYIATTYEKIAAVYKKSNKINQAIEALAACIEYAKKAGAWEVARRGFRDSGQLYTKAGQNPEAVQILQKQLDYAESFSPVNNAYMATANMDMAYNHFLAERYQEAVAYAKKSLNYALITKDNFQLLDAYNTIGSCYKNLKMQNESIEWLEKAITLLEQPGQNKFFLSSVLMNAGGSYYEIGQNKKGLAYKERSLKLCQELKNVQCQVTTYISLGLDLIEKDKEYDKGIEYLLYAEKLLDPNASLYINKYIYDGLYKAYQAKGEYQKAFEYISKYLVFRDSIMTTEKQKQVGELEAKYESDKKAQQIELLSRNKRIQELQLLQNQADLEKQMTENKMKENSILLLEKDKDLRNASLKEKEAEAERQKVQLKLLDEQKKITESENRNQRLIIYSFIGGLILLVVLLFAIYKNYREKKKANLEISAQKEELQVQKEIVDLKNKEITDSITYAKRLQEAILPPAGLVNRTLKNSFILYIPKDIVAGDFYWMETIRKKKSGSGTDEELILLAAADCTGHGVPGAMVSVVCSNALNRTVKEFGVTEPGKILDKVRELVIETFDKSESEVKDGMDISLCAIDTNRRIIQWAGANNPLWILEKQSKQIRELKADKQPVGKFTAQKEFTTHELQLNEGDSIYLFTDGYPDQFGGPKGKKFKYSSLSALLKESVDVGMSGQKEILRNTFHNWKGSLEQVDDVCIIGVKL